MPIDGVSLYMTEPGNDDQRFVRMAFAYEDGTTTQAQLGSNRLFSGNLYHDLVDDTIGLWTGEQSLAIGHAMTHVADRLQEIAPNALAYESIHTSLQRQMDTVIKRTHATLSAPAMAHIEQTVQDITMPDIMAFLPATFSYIDTTRLPRLFCIPA